MSGLKLPANTHISSFLGRSDDRRPRRPLHIVAAVLVCAITLGFICTVIPSRWSRKRQQCADEFAWKNVRPEKELHWRPCYHKYQCARLQVPLDNSNPGGAQVGIALYKLPAVVSPLDSKYRGPILINPGGPGNPPFSMLQSSGDAFQSLVGAEFDIIAFDPRGVGETTPIVYGFEDSAERETWSLLEPALINATSDALSKRIARARVLNRLIKQKSGSVAEHVHSAAIARDMLSIVRAHGRRRLQYWGQSYGSTLGITYATLFPDNVGPMLLDGGPDVNDYYSTRWAANLVDTSKTVNAFYDGCAAAGPSRCAFHRKTAAEVKRRLNNLYSTVSTHPVPGFESGGGVYGVVDYSTLQQAFHDAVYRPYDEFPDFAQALAELEAGNGTRILSRTRSQRSWCPKCDSAPRWNGYRVEGRLATMCSDGEPVTDTEEELMTHYRTLANDSSFADIWASFRVGCSGWDIRPKVTMAGPFSANTSFPLLFLGNTADPISPLRYMQATAANYNPSVLLTQNAFGHCSTAARSKCTDGWIRKYFRDGILPPPKTVCEIDVELFEDKSGNVS